MHVVLFTLNKAKREPCVQLWALLQEDTDPTQRDQRKAVRMYGNKLNEQGGISGPERTQLKEMFNSLYTRESLLQNRKE